MKLYKVADDEYRTINEHFILTVTDSPKGKYWLSSPFREFFKQHVNSIKDAEYYIDQFYKEYPDKKDVEVEQCVHYETIDQFRKKHGRR